MRIDIKKKFTNPKIQALYEKRLDYLSRHDVEYLAIQAQRKYQDYLFNKEYYDNGSVYIERSKLNKNYEHKRDNK